VRCGAVPEFEREPKKQSSQPRNFAGAKEAAEKGLNLRDTLEKHPAGAEAHPLLSASCGPTKVVPLLQNLPELSFSATCKARLSIDPARMQCEIAAAKQPQVLRLRCAPLRMTDF
jgi:hypothetical protein